MLADCVSGRQPGRSFAALASMVARMLSVILVMPFPAVEARSEDVYGGDAATTINLAHGPGKRLDAPGPGPAEAVRCLRNRRRITSSAPFRGPPLYPSSPAVWNGPWSDELASWPP